MDTEPPGDSLESVPSDGFKKEISLRVFVETFDTYIRAAAEIAAELGLTGEPTVEVLMGYWVSLPQADDLVRDFVRGDLSMFSLGLETRQMVERDLGRLELEPADLTSCASPTTPLGKKLDSIRRSEAGARIASGGNSELETFVRGNPDIVKQVASSSHEVLVLWVMLYLMHATKARERGHRAVSEFIQRHPEVRERIKVIMANHSRAIAIERSQRQKGSTLSP